MEVYDEFDKKVKRNEGTIEDLDRRFRQDSRRNQLSLNEQDDKINFIQDVVTKNRKDMIAFETLLEKQVEETA